MDWFRVYHGMPTDPKWLLVARRAGNGATPGHVVAIWSVLLDHASLATPRGSVKTVDLESVAASLGWPDDLVEAIHGALIERRHIVDGFVRTWIERNPVKFDATNAERQQRHRQKAKAARKSGAADAHDDQDRNDSNGRYCVTVNESRQVTPTEEREQSNCSISDSSEQDPTSSLKLDTSRTVRARAGVIIDPGAFWSWLAGQGLQAHIGIRTMNRGKLSDWIQQGLTVADLDTAMERAKAKRARQRSNHPVNLGYLACFIDEVLTGVQPTTTNGGGYERGDELGREFANAGR